MGAWTTLTHGRHYTSRGCHGSVRRTLPRRALAVWCIGRSGFHRTSVGHITRTVSFYPRWTRGDSNPGHPPCKGGTLPLSYEPYGALVVLRCPVEPVAPKRRKVGLPEGQIPVCGGDPAADSPTATLLRLKPPCGAQIRPARQASSGPHSGALTGGVCKEQGRIHRTLLECDYYRIQLHVDELQSTIRTTTEFLRLPLPLGVGTHCLGHCSPRVAQPIRGILTYRCPFLPPPWRRQSS